MSHWVDNEVKIADLGDKRLNKRMKTLLKQLGDKHSESIPTACGGFHYTHAAYLFLDNEIVPFNKILASHVHAS